MTVRDRRIAGAAGILFVAAAITSFVAPGVPPAFDDPLPKITKYFVDNDSQIVASAFVTLVAVSLALVFFTGLFRLLRSRAAGFDVATVFYAGGIVSLGVVAVGTAALAVPAWQSEQLGTPSDETVRLMFDFSNICFLLLSVLIALVVAAASVAILRDRLLPAWLGWLGGLVAASNMVAGLGITEHNLFKAATFDGFLAFMAWVLLTSLVLVFGGEELGAAT